jgi:hypothetical protein
MPAKPCTNAGHNVGESPCPDCGCGFTNPCLLLGCPHCDRAVSAPGRRLTKTARELKAAEAAVVRWEKKSQAALTRLLKFREEARRLRARLAKLEAEAARGADPEADPAPEE